MPVDVPAIELVEGTRVVSMFEEFSLGLKPVRTFRVEREFFASFEDAGHPVEGTAAAQASRKGKGRQPRRPE